MAMTTETLLYMAARAQLVDEVVRPALARGTTVVCERFLLSTAVYQGIAGGAGTGPVFAQGRFAIGRTWPGLTLLLDIDSRAAERRHRGRKDRIERRGLAFQRKVRAGFRRLARRFPGVAVVDARGSVDEVARRVGLVVRRRLGLDA
jgi:dTMP kinase